MVVSGLSTISGKSSSGWSPASRITFDSVVVATVVVLAVVVLGVVVLEVVVRFAGA